ncbi:hypothetical protein BFJ63_vAg16742 [Fusarium oxysporum f. sp. narcissi]|uniref:Amidohydrolase 3 domain-containing protein n=1 Tax=Fusarium oxysporum f. sp. narcissi TaxID=451672 RepID=A0A4Q2V606_FUSOX|nr:hypothetical protein BFJ63_vAg16742 [Fusarium oxysporum f. sp. narcissi]
MVAPDNKTTIFIGGTVRIDENTVTEAIAIRDGRVLHFGDRDVVLRNNPGAKEVDITGSVMIPGLIDTHPHMLHFALFRADLVDLRKATSWDYIVRAIRDRAKTTPQGEWIMTTPVGDDEYYFIKESWRDLPEGALPDASVLDSATSEHPVLIQAWAPQNPNIAVLNTAAIKELGLDGPLPDSEGQITLERNSDGELTGRIMGAVNNIYSSLNDAWADIWSQIPFLQPDLIPSVIGAAMQQQNMHGVTTIYEGHCMDAQQIEFYKTLNDEDKLTVRVMSAPDVLGTVFAARPLDEAQLVKDLDAAVEIQGDFGDMLKVNGFCLVPTGPGYNGVMVMKDPYKGPIGNMVRGRWVVHPDLVEKAMRWGKERGLRVNIGGGGLGENDTLLDILDKLREEGVITGEERWIMQHGFFMNQSQAERYSAHGFQATVCPGFTYGKAAMYAERMGDHVLEHLGAFRRMIDAGIDVAGSSDWGPRSPFKHMSLAVLHEIGKGDRRNDGPAQVVTQKEAYAMWGRQAAKVLGWPNIGDLHPGSHADLVLLDRDPVECPIEDLAATEVTATWLGGRLVSGASV